MSIVLIGGSGQASLVLNVALRLGLRDQVMGVYDDNTDLPLMARWGVPRLGGMRDVVLSADDRYFLCIGIPAVKRKLLAAVPALAPGRAVSLIDPLAFVGWEVELGEGALLLPSAHVSPLARIGTQAYLSQNTSIGHDSVIGDNVSVMPGATVGGNAVLGDDVLIGTNATVLQGLSIGDGVTVGAGAVVTKDLPPGVTVVGSPARAINRRV